MNRISCVRQTSERIVDFNSDQVSDYKGMKEEEVDQRTNLSSHGSKVEFNLNFILFSTMEIGLYFILILSYHGSKVIFRMNFIFSNLSKKV